MLYLKEERNKKITGSIVRVSLVCVALFCVVLCCFDMLLPKTYEQLAKVTVNGGFERQFQLGR